jgi:hypothetical protein
MILACCWVIQEPAWRYGSRGACADLAGVYAGWITVVNEDEPAEGNGTATGVGWNHGYWGREDPGSPAFASRALARVLGRTVRG